MKKLIIITILLLFILPVQAQKVEIKGVNLNNNKITVKTSVNGHKVTLKSPKLSSNKVLKLISINL